MTLGRTADSKIKIKTDGGLRAVECACCVEEACGSAVPTPPAGDPAFFAKLSGASVTPFTQVSIDYSIGSSNGYTVSGSHSGQWVAPTNCAPGSPYIRVADFSCSSYDGCGVNATCDKTLDPYNNPLAVGDIFLALSPGNLLSFTITEGVLVARFSIAPDGLTSTSITINGQSQFSCVDPGPFGGTVFGFADLVFS